jgi:hypothetical protein
MEYRAADHLTWISSSCPCSSRCMSWWWNPGKPVAAYRDHVAKRKHKAACYGQHCASRGQDEAQTGTVRHSTVCSTAAAAELRLAHLEGPPAAGTCPAALLCLVAQRGLWSPLATLTQPKAGRSPAGGSAWACRSWPYRCTGSMQLPSIQYACHRSCLHAHAQRHRRSHRRFGVLTGVCLHCCLWQLCMTPKGNGTYPTCMM